MDSTGNITYWLSTKIQTNISYHREEIRVFLQKVDNVRTKRDFGQLRENEPTRTSGRCNCPLVFEQTTPHTTQKPRWSRFWNGPLVLDGHKVDVFSRFKREWHKRTKKYDFSDCDISPTLWAFRACYGSLERQRPKYFDYYQFRHISAVFGYFNFRVLKYGENRYFLSSNLWDFRQPVNAKQGEQRQSRLHTTKTCALCV